MPPNKMSWNLKWSLKVRLTYVPKNFTGQIYRSSKSSNLDNIQKLREKLQYQGYSKLQVTSKGTILLRVDPLVVKYGSLCFELFWGIPTFNENDWWSRHVMWQPKLLYAVLFIKYSVHHDWCVQQQKSLSLDFLIFFFDREKFTRFLHSASKFQQDDYV